MSKLPGDRARADPALPGTRYPRGRDRQGTRAVVRCARGSHRTTLGPMVCLHPNFPHDMNTIDPGQPHFYFALPRLLASMRGADGRRAEKNGTEATVVSVAIYLINYLFFAQFVPSNLPLWQLALWLAGVVFLTWFFWLLVLYSNSLFIKLLRQVGLFRSIPTRRAQSILLGIWATAMALDLLKHGSWIGEVASIWLVAVAMNLAAAAVLAFRHGASHPE